MSLSKKKRFRQKGGVRAAVKTNKRMVKKSFKKASAQKKQAIRGREDGDAATAIIATFTQPNNTAKKVAKNKVSIDMCLSLLLGTYFLERVVDV